MGTSFICGATQGDIVNEILEPLKRGNHLVTSRLTRGDGEPVLWTVEKGEKDEFPGQGVLPKPYQFIGCYVLREADGDWGWGYKPMDETMGPCFYCVPKAWLKKYPCIIPDGLKGYSDEWRKKVRKFHGI